MVDEPNPTQLVVRALSRKRSTLCLPLPTRTPMQSPPNLLYDNTIMAICVVVEKIRGSFSMAVISVSTPRNHCLTRHWWSAIQLLKLTGWRMQGRRTEPLWRCKRSSHLWRGIPKDSWQRQRLYCYGRMRKEDISQSARPAQNRSRQIWTNTFYWKRYFILLIKIQSNTGQRGAREPTQSSSSHTFTSTLSRFRPFIASTFM